MSKTDFRKKSLQQIIIFIVEKMPLGFLIIMPFFKIKKGYFLAIKYHQQTQL